MASTELLDSYADLSALRKETDVFLSYLKELENQYNILKNAKITLQGANQIGPLTQSINTASAAMTGFSNQINQVNAASQNLNQTAAATVNSTVSQAKAVNDLSDSYNDLVKASVAIQLSQKQLLADRKALDKSFKDGKISEDAYLNEITKIKSEQLALAQSNQEVNLSLRNLGKEASAANGSLDKLRAQLNLSHQAFKRLSDDEKKSDIGTSLKKNIQSLTKTISDQEQGIGLFQRNVGNYGSALKGLGGHISGLIGSLATAGIALIGLNSIGDFLSGAIEEFNQAEQAAKRFQNTLKNAGRLDVLPSLTAEANKLAEAFGYLDNDNITEVFQKLAIYGKLTENQIKQLTPVIIDFAKQQGISLEESASVIIKALEGNGRALKEYGINIKDAKSTTEAFGLVMTDLAPKVAGAAKAFGETTAGQIAITKQEINNLKEDIGGKLQPAIRFFYEFVSDTLRGMQRFFSGIGDGLSYVGDKISGAYNIIKLTAGITKDLFSLDFDNPIKRLQAVSDQKKANEELLALNKRKIESESQYQEVLKKSQDVANGLSSKTVIEQNKLLSEQLVVMEKSKSKYSELINAGKQNAVEGKKAEQQFQKDYILYSAMKSKLDEIRDKRTIGGGDPNKPFTTTAKAPKKPEDFTNDLIAAAERERKYREELNKLLITDDANSQDKISQNEKNSLDVRLDALDKFLKDKEALIYIDTQLEISNIDAKLTKISEIENKPDNKRTTAEKKLLIDKAALTEQRVLLEAQAQSKETALAKDGVFRRLEILKSAVDLEEKIRIENYQAEKDQDQSALNDKLIALNLEFEKKRDAIKNGSEKDRVRVEEDFANKRLAIIEDFNIEALDKDISFTEQTIELAKQRGEDTSAAEKKINAIRLQQSDLIANRQINNSKREQKTNQERLTDLKKTLDEIGNIYGKLQDVFNGALEANATAKKNAIQDQIDLLNKRTQTDIDGINASTLSEQDKADKIAIINARAAAQKEQLELRQRQIDERKARFQKAAQIGTIAIAGAQAVVAALGEIPFTPANIVLAAIVGAIAAAQLAVAIATPIPKYKDGTQNHPGGWAMVGDGGISELIKKPDGSMYISPTTPTYVDLPPQTKVYPDVSKLIEGYGNIALKKISMEPAGKTLDFVSLEKTMKKELRNVRSAIQDKPTAVIRHSLSGWVTGYEANQRHVEWVNRLMK